MRIAAFVDDTVRDIVYALRGFARAPLVAFTIVSTVALGLGLVAVAFTLLNAFLFRVDQVPRVHELFAVERPRTSSDEREPFTRPQFDALRRETAVFTDAFAQVSDVGSHVDGRKVAGTFVTGNAFQVLGVGAAIGRALTPGDDEGSGEPVMVLSHRGWDRLFARDTAILGRRMVINGFTFEIVGVMPERFRGLAVAPDDYWAPLSTLSRVRRGPAAAAPVGVSIIGRLKPGISREGAVAQLAVWYSGQIPASATPRSTSTITLARKDGTVPQPLEAVLVTAPLFFAFGLILLIGCANVANLLLARAVVRQREIGIRLSLGAARGRIVRQLLTESLLLVIAAAGAGFVISRVALRGLINAMMTSWPPEIGDLRLLVPDADWRVLLFLMSIAVVTTLAFALGPALRAAGIEPVRTIRGEGLGSTRSGRSRDFLIGVQVGASALLLIAAAVFLRSAFAVSTATPGIRISDTVLIRIADETTRAAVIQAVTVEPFVAAVAAEWPAVIAAPREALAASAGSKATVAYKFVSPEYFGVLDIPLVRGRAFGAGERTSNLSVVVVSETTARALWPNANAVGQTVRLERNTNPETRPADGPPLDARTFTVVGVVRDVAGFGIEPFRAAAVYIPTSAAVPATTLVARVHGDPEQARQALLTRLSTIDPNLEEVVPTQSIIRMETYVLSLAFWLTVGLGGLALVLTLSGLFSVLSYLVEQRTREIGVRIALGATALRVTGLVLRQSIRPVGLGLLIGGGSAAGLAALLLASPGAAGIGETVRVLDPVAYAASLLIIIASCTVAAAIPANRAARLDPTTTLRQD